MRQLDSCDFCGRPAEGVFEVVPASVAGESRRLALCADCRATLQSVVDPLLDAAESNRSARGESAGRESMGGSESTGGESADSESSTGSSVENSETDVASHELDATPVDEAATAEGESSNDGSTASASDESAAPDDGVTIDAEGSSGTERSGSAEESSRGRERKPEGYAQVVRLLQNRDGAMPREDLCALATNAYDLDERQFDDAVDAAVENGDVQETGDGLQTE